MIVPVCQRPGVYHVKDLRPGDVLRNPTENKPLVVADVTAAEEDNGDGCVVVFRDGRQWTTTRETSLGFATLVATGPDAHYPLCVACGETWPCLHTQAMFALHKATLEARHACEHCGQSTSGCKVVRITVADDRGVIRELKYHGRKGPCLTAARKLDANAVPDNWW